MGDSSSSSSPASESFFRKHWEGYKEFWTERFSFLENYSRFVNRDKPLPSWSDSDVDHFIASDPVHGPTVKLSLSLSLDWIIWVYIISASLSFFNFFSLCSSGYLLLNGFEVFFILISSRCWL